MRKSIYYGLILMLSLCAMGGLYELVDLGVSYKYEAEGPHPQGLSAETLKSIELRGLEIQSEMRLVKYGVAASLAGIVLLIGNRRRILGMSRMR